MSRISKRQKRKEKEFNAFGVFERKEQEDDDLVNTEKSEKEILFSKFENALTRANQSEIDGFHKTQARLADTLEYIGRMQYIGSMFPPAREQEQEATATTTATATTATNNPMTDANIAATTNIISPVEYINTIQTEANNSKWKEKYDRLMEKIRSIFTGNSAGGGMNVDIDTLLSMDENDEAAFRERLQEFKLARFNAKTELMNASRNASEENIKIKEELDDIKESKIALENSNTDLIQECKRLENANAMLNQQLVAKQLHIDKMQLQKNHVHFLKPGADAIIARFPIALENAIRQANELR